MKRVLLAVFLLCMLAGVDVKAQQEAQFTHYMFNKLVFNPAYAGARQGICATLVYHNQWLGWQATRDQVGASPVTQSFTLHSPIKLKQKIDLGLGGYVLHDEEGFIGTTDIKLASAFRKKFSRFELGAGLDLGVIQKSIDPTWVAKDPSDPRLPGTTSATGFDAGVGVYVNALKWYVGGSAQHIPGADLGWGNIKYGVVPNYYIMGGYDLHLGANWSVQPSALLKTSTLTTAVWDVSGLALYKERLWAGFNMRTARLNVFSLMAGLYLGAPGTTLGNVSLGYAYDVPTSQAPTFGGTHEIMINYCFNIRFHTEPPVFHKWPRDL